MTITIHNTTKVVTINGVPARIWEGKTDSGIPLHCYVTRVGLAEDQDQLTFTRELLEQSAPSAEAAAIPMRSIL